MCDLCKIIILFPAIGDSLIARCVIRAIIGSRTITFDTYHSRTYVFSVRKYLIIFCLIIVFKLCFVS